MTVPQSILLIRLSSLGDIILSTPLISALRANFPDARIDMVVSKEYADLGTLIEGLTNLIIFDKRTGTSGLLKLRTGLLERKYDQVLDLHNSLRSRLLRRSLSKQVTVIRKRTLKRWLLVKYKVDLLKTEPDAIGRYFETAASLGICDTGSRVSLHIAAERDRKHVVIAPASRHWNKRWPAAYYADLCAKLVDHGYRLSLIAAPGEASIVSEVCHGLPPCSFTSYTSIALPQAATLLRSSSLAITNDSGLMHLAEAVGTPLVSFFGPTVTSFGFAPRSVDSIVLEVEGLYCRPCTAIGRADCPEKHFRCMREVTPQRALELALTVLTVADSAPGIPS